MNCELRGVEYERWFFVFRALFCVLAAYFFTLNYWNDVCLSHYLKLSISLCAIFESNATVHRRRIRHRLPRAVQRAAAGQDRQCAAVLALLGTRLQGTHDTRGFVFCRCGEGEA